MVVGLGPAGPEQLTVAAVQAIERVPPGRRFLRTARHPAAVALGEGTASFDRMYRSAETIDGVYPAIVEALVGAAADGREVLYAVPGSPLVAERTVELLLADPRVTVDLVPGMSFTDLAWARLGVDPVAAGVRLVDGHRFAVEAAGERGPLLVAQCDSKAVLSDIKLAVDWSGDLQAVVLCRLGLPDESVRTVAWADLDRDLEPDHLTSVYIPALAAPVAGEVARFAELVRTLRQRCPWDREQTHASLTRHLLEETYEVLEAIAGLDPAADTATAASTTWRRSWATCSSRSSSTPPWPPRRATSPWPMWPGASTTSSSIAIHTCSATSRPRPPARWCRTGSGSRRRRRAGPA